MYSVKYEELNHRRRQGGLSVTVGFIAQKSDNHES